MYVCMVITYRKGKDQPGKVANPARGQLNRENKSMHFPCSRSRLRTWSRETRRVRQARPASACSSPYYGVPPDFRGGVYLFKPPYAIGSVPSLLGHALEYRWCSLPRVHRHRASKPQGSSERVLPWQVTMDQLICASLSHTHHWYEVGMMKGRTVVFVVV